MVQNMMRFMAAYVIVVVACGAVEMSLLDELSFYASQNTFTAQTFQVPFSMDNVMNSALELALQSCQTSFKWRRWNCPNADFFLRRTNRQLLLDREDAYVTAITTAAVLYTIAKDCASGIVSDCGCNSEDAIITSQCSDEPEKAEQLFHKHVSAIRPIDFYSSVRHHNYMAVTTLLRKSLVRQCVCTAMGPTGCTNEICWNTLKHFDDISNDILRMYDESVQLTNAGQNTQVVWKNVPLDALVYTKDSPNYCEPDAVPYWNGMRGRQCYYDGDGQLSLQEESMSCQNLCQACGFEVRPQNVVTESRCNCKFTWGFQVQCEMCVSIERQHFCY